MFWLIHLEFTVVASMYCLHVYLPLFFPPAPGRTRMSAKRKAVTDSQEDVSTNESVWGDCQAVCVSDGVSS